MKTEALKYIEIKNLLDPQKTFENMRNEFVDVMYVNHFTDDSVIMLLDVNIDPLNDEDMQWLKDILNTFLPNIGEIEYLITPFNPK